MEQVEPAVEVTLEPGNFLAQVGGQPAVRALSWKQPFASLMLHGKEETRTWPTPYRGWVLICASGRGYDDTSVLNIAGKAQYERIEAALAGDPTASLNGQAIAIGRLSGVGLMYREDADRCFVQWRAALYRHIYAEVYPITPFAFSGSQRWKHLSHVELEQIEICTYPQLLP